MPADLIEIAGEAFYESEEWAAAREQYEWIIKMTFSRMEYGDIYARSFYMLGRIYEHMGEKIKSRDYYNKFLQLWKGADPGIQEIEEAWIRLAGLRSKGR